MTAAPVISLPELHAMLADLPAVKNFPTIDELNLQAADLCRHNPKTLSRHRIGSSRLGEPIYELVVGSGEQHALITGGVHPNEPIGGVTALALARLLATRADIADRLGYTWHIIPCIDPDGTRLNEGWFAGTESRGEYGRHFFRPAPDEQVEWTFPLHYKDLYFDRVMPETLAMMRTIDRVKPTFMCSLHNGEVGGVYYYLSHEAPDLYPVLQAIPREVRIPLDAGEPEVPYTPELATAIYGHTSVQQGYDYLRDLGIDGSDDLDSGASSGDYAQQFNPFSLVSELPYWIHPDADDQTPSNIRYTDVLTERADGMAGLHTELSDVLRICERELTINSPFLRASRQFIPHFRQLADQEKKRAAQSDADRYATRSEVFTGADLVHCFRLRYGGMMLRTLEAEIHSGHGTPNIREQHERLNALYSGWAEQASAGPALSTVPIRDLVWVQLAAIIASAGYAVDKFGPARAG